MTIDRPELSSFLYVGQMVVPKGIGNAGRRSPLMAGFGTRTEDNYLVCGIFPVVPPERIGGLTDLQFFITDKLTTYKTTEGFEPRGSSLN